MIVTVVRIYIKEGYVENFIAATIENHNESIKEKGNLRFDVLQSKDDPYMFTLYEAYETDESSEAHKNTPHYSKWREIAFPLMAKPHKVVAHHVIAPIDLDGWK